MSALLCCAAAAAAAVWVWLGGWDCAARTNRDAATAATAAATATARRRLHATTPAAARRVREESHHRNNNGAHCISLVAGVIRHCEARFTLPSWQKNKKKPSPSQSARRPITERRRRSEAQRSRRKEGVVRAAWNRMGATRVQQVATGGAAAVDACCTGSPSDCPSPLARPSPSLLFAVASSVQPTLALLTPPHSASHTQHTPAHTRTRSSRLRSQRSASVGRQLALFPSLRHEQRLSVGDGGCAGDERSGKAARELQMRRL